MDPVILFFLLGLVAGLARSELRLPPAIYELLSILLLLTGRQAETNRALRHRRPACFFWCRAVLHGQASAWLGSLP